MEHMKPVLPELAAYILSSPIDNTPEKPADPSPFITNLVLQHFDSDGSRGSTPCSFPQKLHPEDPLSRQAALP